MHALIAVGTGRYADPWHPFAANAAAVGDLLTEDGWTVTVDDDVDHALMSLESLPDIDLLVVAAGDPWGTPPLVERSAAGAQTKRPVPTSASLNALAAAVTRGIGILALHSAVASLRDYPLWAGLTGAVWLPGVSMHPPFEDEAAIHVVEHPRHPLAAGFADFTVADERYAHLQFTGSVDVVADHEHDGVRHPVVFTREVGATRVAVDLLGHDPRSYASPAHRELIRRLARWAAAA